MKMKMKMKMKLKSKTLLGLALTTALTSISFQGHAQQAWTGGTTEFTDGSVTVSTPDINNTYINQVGQLSVYRTPNSNVATGETVTIGHDNTSSNFVMKANNGNAVTRILGTVQTKLKDGAGNATGARGGKLTVLDTNGIFFGANSMIDSGAIVASTAGTANISDDGKTVGLSDFGSGSRVVLNGTITVADGGLAAFVAPNVVNNGIITARAGRIELAGANTKTTVDLYGDGLLEIEVDEANSESATGAQQWSIAC